MSSKYWVHDLENKSIGYGVELDGELNPVLITDPFLQLELTELWIKHYQQEILFRLRVGPGWKASEAEPSCDLYEKLVMDPARWVIDPETQIISGYQSEFFDEGNLVWAEIENEDGTKEWQQGRVRGEWKGE